jgi:hypothetical protein
VGIRTEPSEWPLVDELACSALADVDPDLADAITRTATSLLWNWTGRVFGTSEVVVRPCRRDCAPSTYLGIAGIPSSTWQNAPFLPVLLDGEFYNLSCRRKCRDGCGCSSVEEIGLAGPVDSVISVRVDGETLDPSAHRVDNRRWLVRMDGGRWPTCQDLSKSPDEVNTWEIAYRWGTEVPIGGSMAASVLACEMAKAALGRECSLPQRIQSVTREGVTMAILDSFEGLEAGRTGIWLVDSWVTSVTKSPRRSVVLSPDTYQPRVRTAGQ